MCSWLKFRVNKQYRGFGLIVPFLKRNQNSTYMAKETRTGGAKMETVLSPSLKKKFAAKCKKAGSSMSQVSRDLIQKWLKG